MRGSVQGGRHPIEDRVDHVVGGGKVQPYAALVSSTFAAPEEPGRVPVEQRGGRRCGSRSSEAGWESEIVAAITAWRASRCTNPTIRGPRMVDWAAAHTAFHCTLIEGSHWSGC